MSKPNNTETKPLINDYDIKIDTQLLLNNDENKNDISNYNDETHESKYDIISYNMCNSINENESKYESKHDNTKSDISNNANNINTDTQLLLDNKNKNIKQYDKRFIKEGILKHRPQYHPWSTTYYSVLNDKYQLHLYGAKDSAKKFNYREYLVNPKDCVASMKENSKTSFYVIYMNERKVHEFNAENEQERLDWVTKINSDKKPKKLLEYMTMVTKYDALTEMIKVRCNNCDKKRDLYKCSYVGCTKNTKNVSECHACYKRFHAGCDSSHQYDSQYMIKVDNSKINAKIELVIRQLDHYVKDPMIQSVGSVVSGVLGGLGKELFGPPAWLLAYAPTGMAIGLASVGLGFGALAVFAVTTIFDVGSYWMDKITLKELGRRSVRNLCVTVGVTAGSAFGVGAAILVTSGIFGTIAPGVGHVVGIVVGLILGYLFAKYSKKGFDYLWPDEETKHKQEMLKEALQAFQYTKQDTKDPTKFNLAELKKRYHSRAKEVHPDRDNGDHENFILLCEQYGILMAEYNKIHTKVGKIMDKNIKHIKH